MSDFLSPAINDYLKEKNMKDQTRNLNPTFEARIAMIVWGDEYSKQDGGSMDFWDSLNDVRKRRCKLIAELFLDTIEKAKPPYLRATDQLGIDVTTQALISDSKIEVYNRAVKQFNDNLVKEIKK
jgi:hypothetical protein